MERTPEGQPLGAAPEEPGTATAPLASPSTDIMEEPPPYESVGASEAACLFFCWAIGVGGGGSGDRVVSWGRFGPRLGETIHAGSRP
jgi:hypothetical protein